MSLSRWAQLYLWLVVAGAAALLAWWLRSWPEPLPANGGDWILLGTFVALAVLAVHFPLEIVPRQKVNMATAVYFGSLLLFGPPAAMIVGALSQLAGGATRVLRRHADRATRRRSVRGILFNAAQVAIATGLGGLVYFAFLPPRAPAPLDQLANLWALPAAAATMYLANSLAVAAMVGLQQRQRPTAIWLAARRIDALQLAALYPIGVLAAATTADYPWAPALLALPAAAIYLSLRRTMQVLAQAQELARRDAETAALRKLDQLKTELMFTISHELRTPLTVVHGYAEHLAARARTLDAARVEAAARHILTGSSQIRRLVEDLLDFARMERGEVAMRLQEFDLARILDDVMAAFRRQPGGDRLVGVYPASLPVFADQARVMQAISNLVENALKYAPMGPVVLQARVTGASATGGAPRAVRVEVADQGPGIAPEEQPRLWEKFVRGRAVAGFNVARGSGIGLAVVKAVIEAQGGRVGVESTPGRGACFWFELPLPPAAGALPAATPEAQHFAGRHDRTSAA
jgi:signal transduction histidine kinase